MNREKISMPISLMPDTNSYLELGFMLDLNYKNKEFCGAVLPEKWTSVNSKDSNDIYILDEDKVPRVVIITRFGFNGVTGIARLLCRYQIQNQLLDKEKEDYKMMFKDTKTDEILYEQYYSTHEGDMKYIKLIIEGQARKIVERFAETYYPDYLDPHSYWERKKHIKVLK